MDEQLGVSVLVALVAIVGLVVLLNGANAGASVTYIGGDLGSEFGMEEFRGSTNADHCAFVGSGTCPRGYLCTNLQNGASYCM